MKYLFITSIMTLFVIGCTSAPTRETNSEKFNLLKTGEVKKENVMNFMDCLIKGFEVKNRIAYNVKTRLKPRSNGYRIDSIGGDVYLLLSVDLFNSGKTKLLRAQNSELTDLSQQINSYDNCLDRYK